MKKALKESMGSCESEVAFSLLLVSYAHFTPTGEAVVLVWRRLAADLFLSDTHFLCGCTEMKLTNSLFSPSLDMIGAPLTNR